MTCPFFCLLPGTGLAKRLSTFIFPMRFKNLASGSTGNATVVEAGQGSDCRRLLVDCGLGIRQLEARLAQAGLLVSELHGIFITHEHSDHIG